MKKNKKNTIVLNTVTASAILLVMFFAFLCPVFAQYINQEKIPGAEQASDFVQYLKDIINFGFAILGILALFMLIIGAYQYLMAAGNVGKIESAKETIGSALLGLILGLCAWIILYKINPDLVEMRGITQISGGVGSINGIAGTNGQYSAIKPPTTCSDERVISAAKNVSTRTGVDSNILLAFAAKESGCNANVKRTNGGQDCSLMQIRAQAHCGTDCASIEGIENIERAMQCSANLIKKIQNKHGVTSAGDIYAYYNAGENRSSDYHLTYASGKYSSRYATVQGFYNSFASNKI